MIKWLKQQLPIPVVGVETMPLEEVVYLIELIRVTLVHKAVQVSIVQLNCTLHCAPNAQTKVSFQPHLFPLCPTPPTPIPVSLWLSPHCCLCLCESIYIYIHIYIYIYTHTHTHTHTHIYISHIIYKVYIYNLYHIFCLILSLSVIQPPKPPPV